MIESPEHAGAAGFGQVLDNTNDDRSSLARGTDESVQAYLQVIANEMDKQEKHYERGRVSAWISSLGDMAKMLSSVGGRKHVVLFSEGFDGRLMLGRGPDAFDPKAQLDRLAISSGAHWFVDTDDIYGNTALQNYVARMMAEFRRADCIIQAVDISGLGSESAEDRRAKTTGQDALFYMANETGGTLVRGRQQLRRPARPGAQALRRDLRADLRARAPRAGRELSPSPGQAAPGCGPARGRHLAP